jgi:hypothetical protein
MPDPALLALTWRVTRRRLVSSPPVIAAALAFPAFVAWIGLRDSYAAAAKFFFFLLPHIFLIAAQDVVRSDVEGGALESALFLGGRFRGFLAGKMIVLAGAATAYAAGLFGLFAGWGLLAGGLAPDFPLRFALGLLAGFYYLAAAGVLSHFLKAGSNVLVLLLAQSAALVGLIVSTTPRTGLLDWLASGRFPGLGPALTAGGLVAVVPNLIVSGRLPAFALEVLVLLALALAAQKRLTDRLEIQK